MDKDGAPRSEYHGLELFLKIDWRTKNEFWFTHTKMGAGVETGYDNFMNFPDFLLAPSIFCWPHPL